MNNLKLSCNISTFISGESKIQYDLFKDIPKISLEASEQLTVAVL